MLLPVLPPLPHATFVWHKQKWLKAKTTLVLLALKEIALLTRCCVSLSAFAGSNGDLPLLLLY